MATYNSQMFFLGNFADMDTNESNTATENAGAILGNYANPVLASVTVNDLNDDNAIRDNELGNTAGETLDYDVGGGPQAQFIDSTNVYTVRLLLGDGSTADITATSIQTENGDVFLTDFVNDGSFDNRNIQSFELLSVMGTDYAGFISDSSVDNTSVVCLLSGTRICTAEGPMAVETLIAGTQVRTLDHGYVPLTGVISYPIGPRERNWPVYFERSALCPGLPQQALALSPQHRLLCASAVAARMFGTDEVFVSAKQFHDIGRAARRPPDPHARYWHLLTARHEIVFAEGYPVETFLPGKVALAVLGAHGATAAVADQLTRQGSKVAPARLVPSNARQRQLLRRITKNKGNFWDGRRHGKTGRFAEAGA